MPTLDITRRLLFGGLATFVAAAAIPLSRGALVLPTLVGDGAHDDGPALNAWLRGEPIRVLTDRVSFSGDRLAIDHADLAVRESIIFAGASRSLDVEYSRVRVLPHFRGDYLLWIDADPDAEGPVHFWRANILG